MVYKHNSDLELMLLLKKSKNSSSLIIPPLSTHTYADFIDIIIKSEKIYT